MLGVSKEKVETQIQWSSAIMIAACLGFMSAKEDGRNIRDYKENIFLS